MDGLCTYKYQLATQVEEDKSIHLDQILIAGPTCD